MTNLSEFISRHVTMRNESLFLSDINANKQLLSQKIKDKSILVIGGAGSIASSFIKAVLPFMPRALSVVDTNENALAELSRDLRSTGGLFVPKAYNAYPISSSSKIFEKMFRSVNGFDVAANFSAHKHVRSEKDIFSIEAMLRNNVLSAQRLLELLCEFRPEEYFCVSTDKAANPANLMGAGKRIMEDLIFAYSDKFAVKTARFANVAFSNGSLPCGFLERIAKSQPICAPNDIKRYFVSPEESGQICMLSCFLANNREILFPKLKTEQMMGFDQIALRLLESRGYKAEICLSETEALEKALFLKQGAKNYPVYFSPSNTSGEKACEEFFTEAETVDFNRFNALGVITNKEIPNKKRLNNLLNALTKAFNASAVSKAEIVGIIQDYLPNFNHIETGKSLDEKM